MIVTALALAFAIFVWLKTNAFVDFLWWLFRWANILYVRDYLNEPQLVRSELMYPLWLYVNHRNFLTKLISCPLCLSFWTNFFFAYTIQEWLACAFISLLGFVVLDRLYKHG